MEGPVSNSATPTGHGSETNPTDPDEAFAAAWAEYMPMVRRLAASRLGEKNVQLAEDIAQEAFLDFWRYLLTGKRVNSPGALLNRITCRQVSAYYHRMSALKRPRTTAMDFTDPAAHRLLRTFSAEDEAVAELAALDRLCARLQAVTA